MSDSKGINKPNRPILTSCQDGGGDVRLEVSGDHPTVSLHVRKDRLPSTSTDMIGFLAYRCPNCNKPHTQQFIGQTGLRLISELENKTHAVVVEYDINTFMEDTKHGLPPIVDEEAEIRAISKLSPDDFK
ncbi:MAG: hypothetical protein H6799_00395 [Candidatus Nomurabacteria bacterium]|nr:MAG: hypothetical protein H6799_00395 [Candidatus Nomurabacteria bacterium]HRV76140.1 hypothetical protein [Candidatus Saccharimonadales bacterium]